MPNSPRKVSLAAENAALRDLLSQAASNAERMLEQAGIGATENEAAKRLQRLLLEELHHRVMNTLATVMAITSQSLRSAENLKQGRLAVENRLVALGRAHDLLLRVNWDSAKLTEVIAAAIAPYSSDAGRFTVHDSDAEAGPGAILPLTMSLNELGANALKYGALSNSTGGVEVSSAIDEKDQRFRLKWTEIGGPTVQPPTRHGFGTRLIDRLADQLQGRAQLKYEPAGLVYELDIPLQALRAPRAH